MATINKPISIAQVKTTLGENTLDLGTLCRSGKINKWSLYKPVNRPNFWGVLDDDWRKSIAYGLDIPHYVDVKDAFRYGLTASDYDYPTRTAPFRLLDFDGYDHTTEKWFDFSATDNQRLPDNSPIGLIYEGAFGGVFAQTMMNHFSGAVYFGCIVSQHSGTDVCGGTAEDAPAYYCRLGDVYGTEYYTPNFERNNFAFNRPIKVVCVATTYSGGTDWEEIHGISGCDWIYLPTDTFSLTIYNQTYETANSISILSASCATAYVDTDIALFQPLVLQCISSLSGAACRLRFNAYSSSYDDSNAVIVPSSGTYSIGTTSTQIAFNLSFSNGEIPRGVVESGMDYFLSRGASVGDEYMTLYWWTIVGEEHSDAKQIYYDITSNLWIV